MKIQSVFQLQIGDIVSGTLESGYLVFIRVRMIIGTTVCGHRVYNTPDSRESKREYEIPRQRLLQLIRRKNAAGFDIPVGGA